MIQDSQRNNQTRALTVYFYLMICTACYDKAERPALVLLLRDGGFTRPEWVSIPFLAFKKRGEASELEWVGKLGRAIDMSGDDFYPGCTFDRGSILKPHSTVVCRHLILIEA